MSIEAEKSSARAGLGDRPEIDTQKASTDVLMTDGEQTMIGGLFVQDKTDSRSGVPILKDLPWWFFGIRYIAGYNSIKVSRKELLIFIHVELVETLESRIAKKKHDLLSKQLRESSNKFREEFKDLDEVASDIVSKRPGKPLKNDDPEPEEIEQKIDEQLKQEIVVTKTEETVKPLPRPIKKVEEVKVRKTETIDDDTKQIIKKLTEEEKQTTDTKVTIKKTPKKEVAKKKYEPVKKEEIKPEEKKVEIRKIEKPVEKKVEKIETKAQVKKPVITTPSPVKKIEKKKTTPVVTKPIEKKKVVEQPKETKTETYEKTSINDEPSLKPRYTIQIFSSDDYEKTMEEIALFKKNGIDVYIIKVQVEGKLLYRVRSGKFRNFSDAKRDIKNIQKIFPERKDMWIDNL